MAAHFIDVGQGEAVLLEFSCGAVLVDTGGEEDGHVDGTAKFMAYLQTFFARRTDLNGTLDAVFLTHAHGDHTSGAGLAKKKAGVPQTPGLIPIDQTGAVPAGAVPPYKIRSVVTNAETVGSGDLAQNSLNAYAAGQGWPTLKVREADVPRPNGLVVSPMACAGTSPKFTVLWGSVHDSRAWTNDGNNQSLVVRLDFGISSFLFMGDLEQEAHPALIQALAGKPGLLQADVFAPAHHGSHNGTTTALVAAVNPKIAVISAGDPSLNWHGLTARDFAHPNRGALQMLQVKDGGVRWKRKTKTVPVGIKGMNPKTRTPATFGPMKITRAIYATGWDGTVIIEAAATGEEIVAQPN
jgi:competence protein ComEC